MYVKVQESFLRKVKEYEELVVRQSDGTPLASFAMILLIQ